MTCERFRQFALLWPYCSIQVICAQRKKLICFILSILLRYFIAKRLVPTTNYVVNKSLVPYYLSYIDILYPISLFPFPYLPHYPPHPYPNGPFPCQYHLNMFIGALGVKGYSNDFQVYLFYYVL